MGGRTKDLDKMLGDPKKAIKAMMVPLMVSYLVAQVNVFADTAWCSGLGSTATSAIATIFPVYWIIAGLGTGMGIGAAAAIARYLGRGDKVKAESLAVQSIILTVLISLAFMPVLYVLTPNIAFWIGAGDIAAECMTFMKPMIITGLFIILNGTISGILRSEGAATKSMIVLLTGAALNMVFDPILIYGCNMGLAGSGWATALATGVSTLIGLYWYARKKMYLELSMKHFRFKGSELKEILYVGIPRSAESLIINSMSLVQRIFVIACGGALAVAYYNLPWRFVMMAAVISMAAGSALVPVCSAALGRSNFAKAEEGYRYAFKISMISLTLLAAVLFVFADFFVIPFTYSPSMEALRPEFVRVLRIYSTFIPFVGMMDIGSSILQSLRMAQISMVSALLRNLMLIALFYFASKISMDMIYWSLAATQVAGGLMMMGLAVWGYRRYTVLNSRAAAT